MPRDFIKEYYLTEIINDRNMLEFPEFAKFFKFNLRKMNYFLLDEGFEFPNFFIKINNERDDITFGKDQFKPDKASVLFLEYDHRPFCGLGFRTLDYDNKPFSMQTFSRVKKLFIEYIQLTSNSDKKDFYKVKEAIDCNPFELLVAQYIARLSPIIMAGEKTTAKLNNEFRGQPYELPYRRIQEKFFNKDYSLRMSSERVKQIFQ